jgi:hypothetical protein
VVISFRCPHCRAQLEFDDLSHDQSPCPLCGETIGLRITAPMRQRNTVDRCAVCDCHKVYVQKDFNRTLGVAIFVAGAVISLVLYGFNRVWQAFAVLLGCAAADAVLYKVLPEVTICYRCHAQYRQFTPDPANRAFELGLAEKFDPLDPAQRDATAENPAAGWKGR